MGWNGSKSGSKVGFWMQKWVKMGQEPTFAPTLNPFRDFHKNPLFTQFKGGGNCFLKTALRQSRPSIRELCRFAHIAGANLKGGREDFRRNGGKIAENRALTDVNRRYFGVNGRFSAVNRR